MPPFDEEDLDVATSLRAPLLSPSVLATTTATNVEVEGRGGENQCATPQQLCDRRAGNDMRMQQQQQQHINHSSLEKDIVLPSWIFFCCGGCFGRSRKNSEDTNNDDEVVRINHNVLLNLIVCMLYGLSDSLSNGTATAAYLKQLGHNQNGPLGNIEAVQGLASLLTALPVGYIADHFGRSKVIAAGGILMIFTIVAQVVLMEWIGTDTTTDNYDYIEYEYVSETRHAHHHQQQQQSSSSSFSSLLLTGSLASSFSHRQIGLWCFGVIMFCWGTSGGVVNGPAAALYADSIPEGQRSTYYNYLFAFYMITSSVGPLVSIVLFQTLGNHWKMSELKSVIYVGLAIAVLSSFLMLFFDDRKALEQATTTTATNTTAEFPTNATSTTTVTSSSSNTLSTQSSHDNNSTEQQQSTSEVITGPPTVDTDDDEEQQQQEQERLLQDDNRSSIPNSSCCARMTSSLSTTIEQRRQWIPYILFTKSLIFAIGSGMTVKFFPLFFKDEVKMSPSQVQIIYVLVPIVMVLFSTVITKISHAGFGRVQATLVFSILGVACLFSMVVFKTYLDVHPWILVPIYVLRTSLMNCSYPVEESILMDFVPPNTRARWKSLESVSAFGWCGSAALGGWLADRYDYTYTFAITAIIQACGCAVWALLLPLVPRKEGTRNNEEEGADGSNDSATEPLLSPAAA